jgi:uncharacterized protein (TIGR02246 family)
MKGRAHALFFTLALVLFAATASAATTSPKGSTANQAAWMAAMKANDLDAVAATYAEDAVAWMPGSGRLDGRAAIRAYFADWLGSMTVRDVVFSNARVETSGNLSTGWGHYTITMSPKTGGEPIVARGRYTEVSVKRGAKWFYLVDHASEDPPPAGTTTASP